MNRRLQWGRGSRAAETVRRGLEGDRLVGASMGPRLTSRGNRRDDFAWPSSFCFNGAAAHEPRKQRSDQHGSEVRIRFNGAAAHEPRKPPPAQSMLRGGLAIGNASVSRFRLSARGRQSRYVSFLSIQQAFAPRERALDPPSAPPHSRPTCQRTVSASAWFGCSTLRVRSGGRRTTPSRSDSTSLARLGHAVQAQRSDGTRRPFADRRRRQASSGNA